MSASEAEIELYTRGSCHVLALAFERRFSNGFVLVTDPEEIYWEGDGETDDIPAVLHVYALDEAGTAWDALGPRPIESIEAHVRELFPDARSVSLDRLPDTESLLAYVDRDDMADRPLHEVTEADIVEAAECVERLLGTPAATPPR